MIHIEEAVIVEGKYDKIKLSNFLDAMIVETGGFAIYKDKKRLQFIRRLAMERGSSFSPTRITADFKFAITLPRDCPRSR